jgi:long-chain acyl-CoA synthetase
LGSATNDDEKREENATTPPQLFFFSSHHPPSPFYPPTKTPQTQTGEYVAVEKLEAVYKGCDVVEQVWVYGCSLESTLVAVVVPREAKLRSLVAGAASAKLPFSELCALPEARAAVLGKLAEVGRAGKLRGFEIVKGVHLSPEEFSVENDLITPTYKYRRAQLLEAFRSEVEGMYARVRTESGPLKGLI